DAAGAVDGEDAYPLADAEYFILLHLLHVGAQAAVVLAHGDLHALGAGQAFLGGRAEQAAGHRADHRRHGRAATAADATAAHAADHRAGTGTNRGLGALDLHRTQHLDGAQAHGLHPAGLVAAVGVAAEVGSTTAQGQAQ